MAIKTSGKQTELPSYTTPVVVPIGRGGYAKGGNCNPGASAGAFQLCHPGTLAGNTCNTGEGVGTV